MMNLLTLAAFIVTVLISQCGACDTDRNPEFLYCPPPITYAHDGNTTVIPCAVTRIVKKCLWYRGNGNITSKTATYRSFSVDVNGTCNLNLTINAAATGNYTCIPQLSSVFMASPSVRTDVILYHKPDPPRLVNKTNGEITINESRSTNLVCESKNGVPPASISWYIEVDNFTYYSKQVNHSSTLTTGFLREWYAYNERKIICKIQHATLNTTLNDTAVFKVIYKPRLLKYRPLYTVTDSDGGPFSIVFEAVSNSPLDMNKTRLFITGKDESTMLSYKLGQASDDYSLSEAMPIEGSKRDDYMYFTFNISSVTEDVLESKFQLQLINKDGDESGIYDFKIYVRKSTTKWLTIGIGITVVVIFIAAVMFAVISRKGLPWRKSPSCISLINNKKNPNDMQMERLNESRRNSIELNDGVFITSDYQGVHDIGNSPESPRRNGNETIPEKRNWLDTLVQLFIG